MLLPLDDRETAQTLGELCVLGDWACAQGDFAMLQGLARRLTAYVSEPQHCQIRELEDACTSDAAYAASLWDQLKNTIYRSTTQAPGERPVASEYCTSLRRGD